MPAIPRVYINHKGEVIVQETYQESYPLHLTAMFGCIRSGMSNPEKCISRKRVTILDYIPKKIV